MLKPTEASNDRNLEKSYTCTTSTINLYLLLQLWNGISASWLDLLDLNQTVVCHHHQWCMMILPEKKPVKMNLRPLLSVWVNHSSFAHTVFNKRKRALDAKRVTSFLIRIAIQTYYTIKCNAKAGFCRDWVVAAFQKAHDKHGSRELLLMGTRL